MEKLKTVISFITMAFSVGFIIETLVDVLIRYPNSFTSFPLWVWILENFIVFGLPAIIFGFLYLILSLLRK